MHINAFLVLIPLLLDPVSSLTIPRVGEPCRDRGIQAKWGKAPIQCDQTNVIGNQVKPIKSQKVDEKFEPGLQYHGLNARSPAKKDPNKNTNKDTKKTSKPKEQKTAPEGTQTQGEPSSSEPKGPSTRGRKKAQEAQQNPPAEDNKSQTQPSGEQTKTQPSNSADKEKDKQKEEDEKEKAKQSQPGDQALTHRPKPDPKSSDAKPETPGSQNEPAKPDDQEPNKNSGADDKSKPQQDKGKGPATKPDAGDKKDDPKGEKKDYSDTMYHVVTPDPNTKKGEEDLNGERSYYRKIGDGNPNGPSRYGTHNPSFSGVQSHDQEPGVSQKKAKETGEQARKRPGEREEEATTGHEKENAQGESLTEWHKITPKPQDQLEKGQKAWTDEDLRQNLLKQQKAFPNHKSEDKTDEYGKLTQEMLNMCNHEQCTKKQFPAKLRRAMIEQPLLRRRLESLLQERDHLVTLALR